MEDFKNVRDSLMTRFQGHNDVVLQQDLEKNPFTDPAGKTPLPELRSSSPGSLVSDGTTSLDDGDFGTARRVPTGQTRRSRARLRSAAGRAAGSGALGLSYLEEKAVSPQVHKNYEVYANKFLDYLRDFPVDFNKDSDVDFYLTRYFEEQYLRGQQAHFGEKTLAALLHFAPAYGKIGGRSLPRAWRAVRGWRRLTPARSRAPYPLAVWCGVCHQLVEAGQVQMAVFTLIGLACYLRPGENMNLRCGDIIAPAYGVSKDWAILICPERRLERTKTGGSDDSIAIDTPYLRDWFAPVLRALKLGPVDAYAWRFTYPEYVAAFKQACSTLRVPLVPYQLRHSGPSIDRPRQYRSQEEVQKRGRWKAHRSLTRYEKHARLGATWETIAPDMRAYFVECEKYLASIILGTRHHVRLPDGSRA